MGVSQDPPWDPRAEPLCPVELSRVLVWGCCASATPGRLRLGAGPRWAPGQDERVLPVAGGLCALIPWFPSTVSAWAGSCPRARRRAAVAPRAAAGDTGLPRSPRAASPSSSSSGKGCAGVKCKIVVKTEPEDESYIGCPQGLDATIAGVPSSPSTGEQHGHWGDWELDGTRSPRGSSPLSRTDCRGDVLYRLLRVVSLWGCGTPVALGSCMGTGSAQRCLVTRNSCLEEKQLFLSSHNECLITVGVSEPPARGRGTPPCSLGGWGPCPGAAGAPRPGVRRSERSRRRCQCQHGQSWGCP